MQLRVLVDNNTYIDRYYLGEPAVSYYIECSGKKILLDVGYSDVLLRNAQAMGIDLEQVTDIVLSHGHNDHTRGLRYLLDHFPDKRFRVLAHPDALNPKREKDLDIGSPFSREELTARTELTLTSESVEVAENLFFLGEIPRLNDFEAQCPIGEQREGGVFVPDSLLDDSALAYRSQKGIVLLTGCAHSGICNTSEHAKKVCGQSRIAAILGGLHLFEPGSAFERTLEYLKAEKITELYPCHCVSFAVKAAIHQSIPIKEVAVSMSLSWE